MKSFLHNVGAFARTVARSVTDVKFYRALRHKKPGEAIAYLAVLLVFAWMLPFAVAFFVGVRQGLEAINLNVRKHVPADAVFEIKDGKFSGGLTEPIVVRDQDMVMIVNTATSTLALSDKDVGLVVNADGIVERRDTGAALQTFSFKSAPDFKAGKADIESGIERYAPLVIFLFSVFSFLAMAFGLGLGYGATVAVYGAAVWLAFRLLKRHAHYDVSFVTAAYAATAPILAKAIFFWSGADAGAIPTALYWILLGFIIYDTIKSEEVPHGPKGEGQSQGPDAGPVVR